jgi:hypothetical protein
MQSGMNRTYNGTDTERGLRNISVFFSQLGYNQPQIDAAVVEAREAHRADRGQSLIERAFAEDTQGSVCKPAGTRKRRGIFERSGALWRAVNS